MTVKKACEILIKHNQLTNKKVIDYDYDVITLSLIKQINDILKDKKEEIVSLVLCELIGDFSTFAISEKSDYKKDIIFKLKNDINY
jgi:hypothetical protein